MIKNIYIFFLFLKYWIYQIKNITFLKTEFKYDKLKLIISCPRSGTHILEGIINSYLEKLYNLGDGNLKNYKGSIYYNIPQQFNFNVEQVLEKKYQNQIKNFDYRFFVFSHHPIQKSQMLLTESIRPIILVRNPVEVIASLTILYLKHRKNFKFNEKSLDRLIENKTKQVINFYNFWNKELSTKRDKEYIVLKFEDLTKNPYQYINKILKFYKIKINKKILRESIDINSKKNILKFYKKTNMHKNIYLQFTETSNIKFKKKIEKIVLEKLKKINFNKFGYKFRL